MEGERESQSIGADDVGTLEASGLVSAPKLPDHVEAVIAAWWSSVAESIGPLVNTQAYNALGVAHDNLRSQLATALR